MANKSFSLDQIRSNLSAGGTPWQAGDTGLSSLMPEQQREYLGAIPAPDDPSLEEIESRALMAEESIHEEAIAAVGAPAAHDLRNMDGKNYVTLVKDQGNCGSSVAFGTVATVESTLTRQRNDPDPNVDLSEAHLFFCHGRDSGASCKNGWWPGEAYEEFKNKGVVDEACYPYDLSKQDCSMLCSDWQSRIVKITGFSDLTNRPQDIKAWISAKGPVSGCLIVYQDFFVYKSGVYKHVSGSKCGGHCVAIVGYNDSPGYWICKNSWGTNWGELGFFRIAYGQCAIETWRNHSVHGIARNLR